MVIDKIKYYDVFVKVKNEIDIKDIKCLICDNQIFTDEFYYKTFSISSMSTSNQNAFFPLQVYRVCLKCCKTPAHAETIVIPLMKIINGGVIRVERCIPNKLRHYKSKIFYY